MKTHPVLKILLLVYCFSVSIVNAQLKPELVLPIGHTGRLNYAEFSPDGKLVVTTSNDGTAKLWDSYSSKLLNTFAGHELAVKTAKFSPDGKYISTASYDNTVKIWNVSTGELVNNFKDFEKGVNSVAWSPDGNNLATASEDYSVKVFSISSGKLIFNFKDHTNSVLSVKWSPNGSYILSASVDNTAKVWNVHTGELKINFNKHTSRVTTANWSYDGSKIFTSSWDGNIIIWDTSTGTEINRMSIDDMIDVANWSPQGNMIVTGSSFGVVHIWNAITGEQINSMKQFDGPYYRSVSDVAFSRDGSKVISSSGGLPREGKYTKIWDATTGELLNVLVGHSRPISSISLSADGSRIVTASWDTKAIIWEIESGLIKNVLAGQSSGNDLIVWKPNSNILASEKGDHSIDIWDISSGKLLTKLIGHTNDVTTISWSPDGNTILSSSYDGSVKLWNPINGKFIKNLGYTYNALGPPQYDGVYHYAKWSADGQWVTTWAENIEPPLHLINVESGEILPLDNDTFTTYDSWSNKTNRIALINDMFNIYDADSGKVILSVSNESEATEPLWSPDDKNILTISGKTILIWDTKSGDIIQILEGHKSNIQTASWSPDGSLIATASKDTTIKLWDPISGKEMLNFATSVESRNRIIEIWNPNSGKEIVNIETSTESIEWSPDSKFFISFPRFEIAKLWSVNTDSCLQTYYLGDECYHNLYEKNVNWQDKYIVGSGGSKLNLLDLSTGQLLVQFVAIGSSDYFTRTPDNYYMASKNGLKWLSFRLDNKLYSFEQFDLKYNRPDIVINRLRNQDTNLINAYNKAYLKRLKKMGFKEEDLNNDFHIPKSKIKDFEHMPTITESSIIGLDLHFEDSKYRLDRINIWINDVAIYGTRGINLRNQNTNSIDKSIKIQLSQGKNKIQVSCLNVKGAESYKETIEITYEPKDTTKPNLYIVALSVSNYQQSEMNLKYAVKDGRDIANLYAQNTNNTYGNVYIDTLFNSDATLDNVLAIKDKLLKSNVDDQVILYVSGHGLLDDNLDFYFASHDMDFSNPALRGISYETLEGLLDSIPARKKLFMMDACHSGEVDKEDLTEDSDSQLLAVGTKSGIKTYSYKGAKVLGSSYNNKLGLQNSFKLMQELFTNLNRGSGAIIISAAAGDSYALESKEWNNGVFTYAVINGLQNRAADIDKNNDITVSELQTYVIEQVQQLTNGQQKPTCRQGNVEFDFSVWGFDKNLINNDLDIMAPYLALNNLDSLAIEAYERMQWDIRASHILIKLDADAPPIDTLAAFNKISIIRNRIINGEPFEKVAIEVSDDPSACDREATSKKKARKGNGGDLGYFTVFNMVYQFENAAYNTPAGEISPIIRTKYGYHILKVTDIKNAMGTAEVAHIFIVMSTEASVEDSLRKVEKINSIYAKIQEGMLFNDAVVEFSEDKGSAKNNGKLPPFSCNRVVPEFITAIDKLEINEISEPFKTNYGFHIIKLINITKPGSYEDEIENIIERINKDSRSKVVKHPISTIKDKKADSIKIHIKKDSNTLQENNHRTESYTKPELILPKGHTLNVTSAAYSPDGRFIVTSSEDGIAKIWDAKAGKLLNNLKGHTQTVLSANWSPDGKMIVTCSFDKTVKIWDAKSGKILSSLIGYTHLFTSATWSPDSKKLLIECDNTIEIWDIEAKKRIGTLDGHTNDILSANWSPNGKMLAIVSADKSIEVWNIESGKLVYSLNGHTYLLYSAIWSPNGKKILTISSDKTAMIWDPENGGVIMSLGGDKASVTSASWSPDGSRIATMSDEYSAKIWNTESGQLLFSLDGHNWPVISSSWSSDGTKIVTTVEIGKSKIWNAKTGVLLKTLKGHSDKLKPATRSSSWSPNGKMLITTEDEIPQIWDAESGKKLFSLKGHNSSVYQATWSADKSRIVTESQNVKMGLMGLWDAKSCKLLVSFKGYPWVTNSPHWSPNGEIIVSQHINHTTRKHVIAIWDVREGILLHSIGSHDMGDDLTSIDWAPVEKKILTASHDGTVKIWDTYTGRLLRRLDVSAGWPGVTSASWSPDGSRIATSSATDMSHIWDAENGKKLLSFHHSNNLEWSPDGKNVITTSNDNSTKIWNSETGKLVLSIESQVWSATWSYNGKRIVFTTNDSIAKIWDVEKESYLDYTLRHNDNIYSAEWSIDGKKLITKSSESIKIWESKTGELILSLEGDTQNFNSIALSPDGKRIISESSDNTAKIWDIETRELLKTVELGLFGNPKYNFQDNSMLSVFDSEYKINDLITGKEIVQFMLIDSTDYFVRTPDNYYFASKGGLKWLSFRLDNKLYSFEQFDLKYNRPDIVLERLNNPDTFLINAYHKAYLKRLKRMGFKEEDLSSEFHIPESMIEDFEYMPIIEQDKLDLNLNFKDSKYNLDRYNIWVNDVPILGVRGKSLKKLQTDSISISEIIQLSKGKNKIQVSCLNVKGAESYKETVEITYEPKQPIKPDLYIVALSVSKYQQREMNLKYAVKDGRDIANLYAQNTNSTYGDVYIDTLFNTDATLDNVLAIKEKLLKSNVDDQVILYVSGHGLLDNNLDFYFASHDMDFSNPGLRGISYETLEDLLDSIPARKKLFMMDACHSGEVDKEELIVSNDGEKEEGGKSGIKTYSYKGARVLTSGDNTNKLGLQNSFELMQELFTNLNRGSGAMVISAAAGDSYALESKDWNNGVFTYAVINGLKYNAADKDNDDEITVSELRTYVIEQVQELTNGRQKPTSRQENVEFDFRVW